MKAMKASKANPKRKEPEKKKKAAERRKVEKSLNALSLSSPSNFSKMTTVK